MSRTVDPQDCFPYTPRRWSVEDIVDSYARLVEAQESLRSALANRKANPNSTSSFGLDFALDFYEYDRDLLLTLQELFGLKVVDSHEWEGYEFYGAYAVDHSFDSIVRHYNRVRADIFGQILVGRIEGVQLEYGRELYQLQTAHADHIRSILVDIARTWDDKYQSYTDEQLAASGFDPRTRLRPDPNGMGYF